MPGGNVLEEFLIVEDHQVQTIRYVGYRRILDTLQSMNLDAMGMNSDDIQEVLEFLNERNISDQLEAVVTDVFRDKTRIDRPTRFSDGTRRVFYSALEIDTVDAEIMYWYMKDALLRDDVEQVVHYCRLACQFRGRVIDLRPHVQEMNFLVADDGYPQCHLISAEAVAGNLDALLTPSARNQPHGTCLPVFSRSSLLDPALDGDRQFRVNVATGVFAAVDA